MDSKGLKYTLRGEDDDVLEMIFNAENKDSFRFIIRFYSDNTSAQLSVFNIAKIPASKIEKMYELCNQLNSQYRWVKFYVDDSDNTITADMDCVIQLDTCGSEIHHCIRVMLTICDDKAYPAIMKAIYSGD